MDIDSAFGRLQLSASKYALVVADDSHFHAHNGTLWSSTYINTNVDALDSIVIGAGAVSKKIHLKLCHFAVASAKVEFFGGCAFTGGTPIDIINHDLSISASLGNPDISISLNPTISVAGSIFRSLLIPGGGGGANKTGGGSPFSTEFIVPAATQMYMKYTNLDGNSAMYGTELCFYEE
jgi:hypothetical protein